jgi:TRAP-type C4-dicarboxylate transport system substrate-binding protein
MKKHLRKGLLVALGIVCLVFPPLTPAQAGPVIKLKLAHFMSTMHVLHRKAFVPFAEEVAQRTGGKVQIHIYPGGTLGNPKTMVDAIRTGITDIGFVLPEYVPGRFKRSSVFELPFIFHSATHMTKVAYAIYPRYLAPDYRDFKVLWFTAAPLTQLMTVKKPVKTLADFKGMRIRSASAMETEGLKLLGANPIGMPISEVSIALQRGVVHGVLTPFAALKAHKLIDIVRYITKIDYCGALMCILMNKQKWESLSKDAQRAITEAASQSFGIRTARAFDEEDLENVQAAKAKGIKIFHLSTADRMAMRRTLSPIWKEWVRKNASRFPAQQILDATLKAAESNL